jgi:alkylation response protein AidB-like acyl-CoA dehydrogenase
LAEAGFLLTGVPAELGGVWESPPASVRAVAEIHRALARGDPSVALVASMHPTVLMAIGWLAFPSATSPYDEAWQEQRRWAFQTALDGHWWGTITSEPGSGGDMAKTRAVARRAEDGSYRVSGQKHFGSGSGVSSFMMTTAVAEGEDAPDVFVLDVRDQPWDGSTGMTLTAPWDGAGMIATQSHAFRFDDFPARRLAWPIQSRREADGAVRDGCIRTIWAAVTLGIVETALAAAREQLGRRGQLRPFEQVEWNRAETEGWLVEQAYEGMVRAVERREQIERQVLMGKLAIAELAESALSRLSRALGGGAYTRASPFAHWYEDVRAVGYLRPPWALAHDTLLESLRGG